MSPHDSLHVGLSRVGNSFDLPTYVADICMDSVGVARVALRVDFGMVLPGPKVALGGQFELKLIDGKRCIFAGLPVNVRICLDQGDW